MNELMACTSKDIDVQVDSFVAVTSTRYKDKPLIGLVTATETDTITIDWYIGTYSGTWKPWKGRVCGKTVTFTETIRMTDILQTVTFTKAMHLSSTTVSQLEKY